MNNKERTPRIKLRKWTIEYAGTKSKTILPEPPQHSKKPITTKSKKMMSSVLPGQVAPALILPTLKDDTFDLLKQSPEKFTIVVFYRGKHCPICLQYLQEIEEHYESLKQNGMEVVAISMDGKEKAVETAETASASMPGREEKKTDENKLLSFPILHGLTVEMAREWGLYLSSAIPGSSEPDVFSEAGLFVIRPDHTVFMAQVQSAPFTRPNIEQLVGGLKFAGDNAYPARGTFA
jgi:peroxiredoxin